MNKAFYRGVFWSIGALSIGTFGAWLATLLGLPTPAILGSTFAVSLAALLGLPLRLPDFLKHIAFATFGCSLGSGITKDVFAQFFRWSFSLSGLILVMLVVMVGATWVLRWLFRLDTRTALLSASPGLLSYALSLAEGGVADVRTITVLQALRLLLITMGLPLILGSVGQLGAYSQSIAIAHLDYQHTVALIALTYLVGTMLSRLGLPAAYLITGLLFSGSLHLSGALIGRIPTDLLLVGFVVVGTMLGTRFSAFTLREISKLLGAACVVVVFAIGVSAIGSVIYADLLALPFGQVWVAYTPGGVEAMAALALALDYDPTYVATHHIFRLLFLLLLLPLLLKYFGRTSR